LLLALPSASRARRLKLVEKATAYGVRVLTVPTLAELDDGTASVGQLRTVKIIDLVRNMILLAGRTLRDKDHPTGKIEIQITGTRLGFLKPPLRRLSAQPTFQYKQ